MNVGRAYKRLVNKTIQRIKTLVGRKTFEHIMLAKHLEKLLEASRSQEDSN